jgi:hypothetical protein
MDAFPNLGGLSSFLLKLFLEPLFDNSFLLGDRGLLSDGRRLLRRDLDFKGSLLLGLKALQLDVGHFLVGLEGGSDFV